jgi:hypothetical protein
MTANANTTAPMRKATLSSSRSAAAYAARHLRRLSPQRRAQLNRDWHDPHFNAGAAFRV